MNHELPIRAFLCLPAGQTGWHFNIFSNKGQEKNDQKSNRSVMGGGRLEDGCDFRTPTSAAKMRFLCLTGARKVQTLDAANL